MPNALIIGSGLTGAVVARELAEQDYRVTILEKRDHIGGNMYDYIDEFGILVHKYGPHTFHTKKKELFQYMKRYGEWKEFQLTCGAFINGICTPTPFNFRTIDDFYPSDQAEELKQHIRNYYGERLWAPVTEVLACEDALIREYAQFLFENDYRLYTAKQWGLSPEEIDASVLRRVPLRFDYRNGYFDDEYQYMPATSFTAFFEKLLDHGNIEVHLKCDALEALKADRELRCIRYLDKKLDYPVIYTGPINELFENCYGELPYRSLRFEWHHEEIESKQNMPVVAYPQVEGYTRIVEYRKLPVQNVQGTTYEVEYSLPYQKGAKIEPYYPILTKESMAVYEKYRTLSDSFPNLYCGGRLGDFKYYNMDQALERALEISREIL